MNVKREQILEIMTKELKSIFKDIQEGKEPQMSDKIEKLSQYLENNQTSVNNEADEEKIINDIANVLDVEEKK